MRERLNDEWLDERVNRIDARFDHIESRLESMQRTMIRGVIALSVAMIAGSVGVGTFVATQL